MERLQRYTSRLRCTHLAGWNRVVDSLLPPPLDLVATHESGSSAASPADDAGKASVVFARQMGAGHEHVDLVPFVVGPNEREDNGHACETHSERVGPRAASSA
ncbi:uncharacterized protein LOC142559493 [Dermacentor variabilis]|uniref:uncharacterized protein LOC142559493 n=1 Tax=Dermacentor variabilis TaxID=34621 RepID=UPI003F5B6F1B